MFHYFDSSVKEQYYFQSEWIKNVIDLKGLKDDTLYCNLTMTTPVMDKYWQCEVTQREINQFKLGNIPNDKQCLVINAFLKGRKSLYEQDLKWKVVRKDDGDCELVLLFYFDKDLASRIGSFTIHKVSDDQSLKLRQTWLRNSVESYREIFELSNTLDTRLHDVEEMYEKSKRNLKEIQARNTETYFTNLSKHTQLLNAKKIKIRKLLGTDKETSAKVESLQKRKRENAELSSQNVKPKRRNKGKARSQPALTQQESSSLNMSSAPLVSPLKDEHNTYVSSSDDELDLFTQTSSNLPSQTGSQQEDKLFQSPLPILTLPELNNFPNLSSEPQDSANDDFKKLFFDTEEEDTFFITKTT